MAIVAFATFNIITIIVGFLVYASGLTWKTARVERLLSGKSWGKQVLEQVESDIHVKMAEFSVFPRIFVQKMMPLLLEETRRLTRLSADPVVLMLFGLFCLVYAIVWAKSWVLASRDDLRYLIGTEMLLMKRT